MTTYTEHGYLENPYLEDAYLAESRSGADAFQFTAVIADSTGPTPVQFEGQILDSLDATNFQFTAQTADETDQTPFQFTVGPILHFKCAGYLDEPYLTTSYLTATLCGAMRTQFNAIGLQTTPVPFQFQAQIVDELDVTPMQFQGVIDDDLTVPMQFKMVAADIIPFQFRVALYNTTNLRWLCEFPSRGDGTNWSSTSTASGDFSPNNLNTDIVEQVWRSETGVLSATLDQDSGVGVSVFTDTIGILNHNLTTSASVTAIGSNNSGHSPAGVTIPMDVTLVNMFHIAPTLPLDGYRFWRFVISDPTNTEGHIQIGTIVFGPATIFQGECFIDRVRFGNRHFKDQVFTEGHTNVMNDRGLKSNLGLSFRDLDADGGNFENLKEAFDTARTDLKCLWIPDPQTPTRFAVFGKLASIPQETHNFKSKAYVDLSLEVDESL